MRCHVTMGRLERCIYKLRNTKGCQQLQKLRERHGTDCSLEFQREHSPTSTLIAETWPTDCETMHTMHSCCFKPLV